MNTENKPDQSPVFWVGLVVLAVVLCVSVGLHSNAAAGLQGNADVAKLAAAGALKNQPLASQTTKHTIVFPAYDQRTEFNTAIFAISPFCLDLQLPTGWSIKQKKESDLQYPLMGAWTPLGLYNEEEELIGAVGYNIYAQYEKAEETPIAIYNQIALANHYFFDTQPKENGHGAYQPVMTHANGVTAITRVYTSALMSKELGYANEAEIINFGILSFNKELLVYIAMELDAQKMTDEMLMQIAKSIAIRANA